MNSVNGDATRDENSSIDLADSISISKDINTNKTGKNVSESSRIPTLDSILQNIMSHEENSISSEVLHIEEFPHEEMKMTDSVVLEYLAESEEVSTLDRLQDILHELEYVLKQSQVLLVNVDEVNLSESHDFNLVYDNSSSEIIQNVILALRDISANNLISAIRKSTLTENQNSYVDILYSSADSLSRLVSFIRTHIADGKKDVYIAIIRVLSNVVVDIKNVTSSLKQIQKQVNTFMTKHFEQQSQGINLVTSGSVELQKSGLPRLSSENNISPPLSAASSRSSLSDELQELRRLKNSLRLSDSSTLLSPKISKDSMSLPRYPQDSTHQRNSRSSLSLNNRNKTSIGSRDVGGVGDEPCKEESRIIQRAVDKDVDRVILSQSFQKSISLPNASTSADALERLNTVHSEIVSLKNFIDITKSKEKDASVLDTLSNQLDKLLNTSSSSVKAVSDNKPTSKAGIITVKPPIITISSIKSTATVVTSPIIDSSDTVDWKALYKTSILKRLSRMVTERSLKIVFTAFSHWVRYSRYKTIKLKEQSQCLLTLNRCVGRQIRGNMQRCFQQWARVNQYTRFRDMYHSVALSMQSHVDDIQRTVSQHESPMTATIEAIVAINRELNVLKNEQYRVIEEYQLKLLQLDKSGLSVKKNLARGFLFSREQELIKARSEVRVLHNELESLLLRAQPHSATFVYENGPRNNMTNRPSNRSRIGEQNTRAVDPDREQTFEISSLSRQKALQVITMELRRLQVAKLSQSSEIKLLKEQLGNAISSAISQRRAIQYLEYENSGLRAQLQSRPNNHLPSYSY